MFALSSAGLRVDGPEVWGSLGGLGSVFCGISLVVKEKAVRRCWELKGNRSPFILYDLLHLFHNKGSGILFPSIPSGRRR